MEQDVKNITLLTNQSGKLQYKECQHGRFAEYQGRNHGYKTAEVYLVHYVSGRIQNSRGCTLYTMSVVGHKTAEVVPCALTVVGHKTAEVVPCALTVVGHKTAEVVPHTLCQW